MIDSFCQFLKPFSPFLYFTLQHNQSQDANKKGYPCEQPFVLFQSALPLKPVGKK